MTSDYPRLPGKVSGFPITPNDAIALLFIIGGGLLMYFGAGALQIAGGIVMGFGMGIYADRAR